MPLRPARCYREYSGPPYTRLEYIKSKPPSKITKFTMGNPSGDFDVKVLLVSMDRVQVRSNALEAARVAANKYLAKSVSTNDYCLIVKTYPHHILRENPMLTGAGADRLQEGMRLAFGKPIGRAARVEPGDVIIEVRVKKNNVDRAKEALRRANAKLPARCRIVVEEIKK